jgi:3-carboxy-cis,cis-muconate cycloisomerase
MRVSRTLKVHSEKLRHETEIAGYPIPPLVLQLSEVSARYLLAAITQDIMDTANVLRSRPAPEIVALALSRSTTTTRV